MQKTLDIDNEITAKKFAEQVGGTVQRVVVRGEAICWRVYYYD